MSHAGLPRGLRHGNVGLSQKHVLAIVNYGGGTAREVVELVGIVKGGADETDGIEATSVPLGARFPNGLLVVMNSVGKNFMLYDWRDVEAALANYSSETGSSQP